MKFDVNVCVDQVGFRQGFIVGFRAEERSGMFFPERDRFGNFALLRLFL